MTLSVKQIENKLKRIIHPSTEKDIISMGLVQNLKIDNNNVYFDLSFPAFNDPLKNSLKRACEQILKEEVEDIGNINIKVVTQVKPIINKPSDPLEKIGSIIAISSGKGGVGKSTVAANLAVAFANTGAKVGLIDADVFGPSIPKMFGVEDEKPYMVQKEGKDKIVPIEKYGVKLLSIGFFVNPNDATIWRGPMASNALKQMVNDGDWEGLDYLFIDLPPGTSDIHITVSQDIKLTGAIIVSTPQEVALADVIKGINMFRNEGIGIPVLGLIENMAWFTPSELPDNKYFIFGKGGCQKLSNEMNVPLLGQIPLIQSIRENGDNGTPSVLQKNAVSNYFKDIAQAIRTEALKQASEVNQ
jgi:ATP-binding protein involved in chromosome partitioning